MNLGGKGDAVRCRAVNNVLAAALALPWLHCAVLWTVDAITCPLALFCACRTSISELSMNRWFVGTTWAMLTVIGGLLVLLYNLYPDRGLESWEKRCVQSCVCVCVCARGGGCIALYACVYHTVKCSPQELP